jgi:hypothetical protein
MFPRFVTKKQFERESKQNNLDDCITLPRKKFRKRAIYAAFDEESVKLPRTPLAA